MSGWTCGSARTNTIDTKVITAFSEDYISFGQDFPDNEKAGKRGHKGPGEREHENAGKNYPGHRLEVTQFVEDLKMDGILIRQAHAKEHID